MSAMGLDTEQAGEKLREFFLDNRRLPTYQELADLFGYASKNASYKLVNRLIEEGIVTKDEKGKLAPTDYFYSIPTIGTIQAGLPIEAEQVTGERVTLFEFMMKNPDETFALKVIDTSMQDKGINPGDIALIDRKKKPKNGDIVAYQVESRWQFKTFATQGDTISPEQIKGVLVSVVRKYH
jgi:SOS-response transcriptional repressor LexA